MAVGWKDLRDKAGHKLTSRDVVTTLRRNHKDLG